MSRNILQLIIPFVISLFVPILPDVFIISFILIFHLFLKYLLFIVTCRRYCNYLLLRNFFIEILFILFFYVSVYSLLKVKIGEFAAEHASTIMFWFITLVYSINCLKLFSLLCLQYGLEQAYSVFHNAHKIVTLEFTKRFKTASFTKSEDFLKQKKESESELKKQFVLKTKIHSKDENNSKKNSKKA